MENQSSVAKVEQRQIHAALEHLSGEAMGTECWLYSDQVDIVLGDEKRLDIKSIKDNGAGKPRDNAIARFTFAGGTYRLEAFDNGPLWVNGRRVEAAELIDGDVIEFGEKGPLSRFSLTDNTAHNRRHFTDICADCWDTIKASRKPMPVRVARSLGTAATRAVSSTTLLFRAGVVVMLALLGWVTYQQQNINKFYQERLAIGQGQMDNFAQKLVQNEQEALSQSDLEKVRNALAQDLSVNVGRLEALEKQSRATETVISTSTPSVVFLQGAYGFREAASGRVLRHVVVSGGRLRAGPDGKPLLSLDGDGPPAERRYTGTGFVIGDGTVLATNRHVAVPWKSDDGSAGTAASPLEPFMIKFMAYSPGSPNGRAVELIKASDDADVALVRFTSPEDPLLPLRLADEAVGHGASVIVMGYPTGFRSMLARSGTGFVEELQQQGETGFWEIASLLAAKGFIEPLSSLGIVAQLTSEFLVYDAATTQGGSGGPVLNSKGEVVAVNAAILRDYTGSNFGVSVQKLRELIVDADVKIAAQLEYN